MHSGDILFEALHGASMCNLHQGLKAIAAYTSELKSTSKEVQLLSYALDIAFPVDGSCPSIIRNGLKTRIKLTHISAQNLRISKYGTPRDFARDVFILKHQSKGV